MLSSPTAMRRTNPIKDHRTQEATPKRGRAVAAGALAALLATTACSSTNNAPAAKTAPPTVTSEQATFGAPVATSVNTLHIVGLDYKYRVTGRPRPGLVTITFDNNGNYAHELSLGVLKPGKTLTQFTTALKGKNAETATAAVMEHPNIEVNAPLLLSAHGSEKTTIDLPAGHYVLTCFLPGPDGTPNALKGMVGEFTVSGSTSDAAPPHTVGTVLLKDNGITLPTSFANGGTFAVNNVGTKPHDFALMKIGTLLPLGFVRCFISKFSTRKPIDSCSGTNKAGITSIPPGKTGYLTVSFAKGRYGYFSTAGDTPTTDIKAGLTGTFTVN